MFNVENFLLTLPMMGWGMLGIFVVTLLIYLCIVLLNRLSRKKS
ncbi:MAG: hypothetical protein ACOYJA_08730 [Christensenellales bacterium]|jgi:hypothetical protein